MQAIRRRGRFFSAATAVSIGLACQTRAQFGGFRNDDRKASGGVFRNDLLFQLFRRFRSFAVLLLCWLAVIAGFTSPVQASTHLDNQKIIKMTAELKAAGIADASVIVLAVNNSDGTYDTSPEAIVALKKSGVSDAVIAAMMARSNSAQKKTANPSAIQPARTGSASLPEYPKQGVWVVDSSRVPHLCTEQRVRPGKEFGGGLKAMGKLAIPIAGVFLKNTEASMMLRGSNSQTQIAQGNVYILIRGLPQLYENDLVLLKLREEKGNRIVSVMRASAFGAEQKDSEIKFSITKPENGVLRLTPALPLKGGHYCVSVGLSTVDTFDITARPS